MNLKLKQEAEEYRKLNYPDYLGKKEALLVEEDFIAGAKSKYVQIGKIKAQLDLLNNFYYGEGLKDTDILDFYKRVRETAKQELEQQLKELNNRMKKAEIKNAKPLLQQHIVSGSALADLNHNVINAAMNIVGLSDDEKVRKEIDRIIDAVKMFTQHCR